MNSIINLYQSFAAGITRYFEDIALLLLRLMGAKVFFESGLTKWNGWFDFDEQKYDLFLYEFFCPDPVREGALLLCDPKVLDYEEGSSLITVIESFAVMAGVMEIVLPVLLVSGLFTRLGALGLLGMTLFIQLAVFPTWDHWWNPAAWWAVVMFAIIARGPGILSLDRLIGLESGKRA
ncbi:MAG: DoxX family protein [Sedimenticolaceae bacterium]